MYQEEINRIAKHYQDGIAKLGQYVTFNELSELDLHPALLRYISGEIDFLIFDDREKLLHNSVFNYSTEKIKYYFSLISAEIRKEKRFSTEYLSKLILHGVSFNIHYLINPNRILAKFVFENESKKPTKEIEQILNYVYFYEHLPRLVNAVLRKKKLANFSVSEFQALVKKIDELAKEDYLTTLIENAIKSMNEFFNIGLEKSRGVQVKALKLFLKEKELTEEISILENAHPDEEEWVHANTLLKLYGIEPDILDYDRDEEEIRESMAAIRGETQENEEEEVDIEQFIKEEIEERFDEIEGGAMDSFVEEDEPGPDAEPNIQEEIKTEEEIEEVVPVTEEQSVNLQANAEGTDTAVSDEAIEEADDEEHGETPDETVYPDEEQPVTSLDLDAGENIAESGEETDTELIIEEENEVDFADEEKIEIHQEAQEESIQDEEANVFSGEVESPENENEITFEDESENENVVTSQSDVLPDESSDEMITETEIRDEQTEGVSAEEQVGGESLEEEVEELLLEDEDEFELVEEEAPESLDEENPEEPEKTGEEDFVEELFPEAESADDNQPVENEEEQAAEDEDDYDYAPEVIDDNSFTDFNSTKDEKKIDVAKLIENKYMSHIIEKVFDYDMQEFTGLIDELSACGDYAEAEKVLDSFFEKYKIDPKSKEGETFTEIIRDHFNRE